MTAYIALIHKEDGSDYGVSFPDFPGCISAGSTLDEARINAAEALALHIEGMIEDGEALPEPSDLATVMRDRENRDAVAFMVDASSPSPKAVRVNITLPEDVLRDIDAFADRQGYSRSGLLVKAARLLIDFSLNPETRTIHHAPSYATWRYDENDNLTLLYPKAGQPGAIDEEALRELTRSAAEVLRQERRRTIKGGWADRRGRVHYTP